MNGLKLWCLQSSLEFLAREEGEPPPKDLITDYADHFYNYLYEPGQTTTDNVTPFKPKGMN